MVLRKRNLLMLAICALLVLVLSSCEVVVHTKVKADGSGTFSISFEITENDFSASLDLYMAPDIDADEVVDFLLEDRDYESIEELCEELGSDFFYSDIVPTVEGSQKKGGLTCNITFSFDNLEEMKDFMGPDDLTVSIDEKTFNYRYEGQGDLDGDYQISDAEWLGIDISASFKVTAPGTIIDTNGTKSGTTVTWDLIKMAEEGGDMSMYVISSTSGGDGEDTSTTLIIVLVVVVVIFLASQKNKSGEEM